MPPPWAVPAMVEALQPFNEESLAYLNDRARWSNSSQKLSHNKLEPILTTVYDMSIPEVEIKSGIAKFPQNIRTLKKLNGKHVNSFLELYDQSIEGSVKERKNRFGKFIGLRIDIA
jgi:hypothetical protein